MAWQDLFKLEKEIYYGYNPKTFSKEFKGCLNIICNGYENEDLRVRVDVLEDPLYTCKELVLKKDKVWGLNTLRLLTQEGPFSITRLGDYKKSDIERHMLEIAHDFPCVAYSIEYNVETDFYSHILGANKPSNTSHFYPFSRSLFHTAEAELDAALLKALKGAIKPQDVKARSQEESAKIQEESKVGTGGQVNAIQEEMGSQSNDAEDLIAKTKDKGMSIEEETDPNTNKVMGHRIGEGANNIPEEKANHSTEWEELLAFRKDYIHTKSKDKRNDQLYGDQKDRFNESYNKKRGQTSSSGHPARESRLRLSDVHDPDEHENFYNHSE